MSYIYAYVFTDDVYRVFIEKKRERERDKGETNSRVKREISTMIRKTLLEYYTGFEK